MPTDCKTIFVKGLPYSFKEDDVGDRFRRFGEIKAIIAPFVLLVYTNGFGTLMEVSIGMQEQVQV